jgi:hypothetical protein
MNTSKHKILILEWPQRSQLVDLLRELPLPNHKNKRSLTRIENKRRRDQKLSQFTSTECSNKFIQRLVFQRDQCTFSTHLSMISSKRLPLKPQSLSDTIRNTLFHLEKSRVQLDSFYLENLLNMLFQKEQKQ